jgi:hypothetical protein
LPARDANAHFARRLGDVNRADAFENLLVAIGFDLLDIVHHSGPPFLAWVEVGCPGASVREPKF